MLEGAPLFGRGYSVITPLVVICPILLPSNSVNQRALLGPLVIARGQLPLFGSGYSVTIPLGVIFPMRFPDASVNQMFPSGPDVIPAGPAVFGKENKVIALP